MRRCSAASVSLAGPGRFEKWPIRCSEAVTRHAQAPVLKRTRWIRLISDSSLTLLRDDVGYKWRMPQIGRIRAAVALFLVAACSSGSSPSASTPGSASGPRVLFVGNSLTEANELPLMVE